MERRAEGMQGVLARGWARSAREQAQRAGHAGRTRKSERKRWTTSRNARLEVPPNVRFRQNQTEYVQSNAVERVRWVRQTERLVRRRCSTRLGRVPSPPRRSRTLIPAIRSSLLPQQRPKVILTLPTCSAASRSRGRTPRLTTPTRRSSRSNSLQRRHSRRPNPRSSSPSPSSSKPNASSAPTRLSREEWSVPTS